MKIKKDTLEDLMSIVAQIKMNCNHAVRNGALTVTMVVNDIPANALLEFIEKYKGSMYGRFSENDEMYIITLEENNGLIRIYSKKLDENQKDIFVQKTKEIKKLLLENEELNDEEDDIEQSFDRMINNSDRMYEMKFDK